MEVVLESIVLQTVVWVYPRERGGTDEGIRASADPALPSGLSPRARGNLDAACGITCGRRLGPWVYPRERGGTRVASLNREGCNPASPGITWNPTARTARVYPRERGGTWSVTGSGMLQGLSPRLRE